MYNEDMTRELKSSRKILRMEWQVERKKEKKPGTKNNSMFKLQVMIFCMQEEGTTGHQIRSV